MSYQYASVPAYQYASAPIAMPSKSTHYSMAPATYSRNTYAVSPTETAATAESGRHSGYVSGYSATESSYAGSSSGDYDSASSANGVDLHEYMQDRFSTAFDPLPLDRSLATQAKTSGQLNAKHREILDLQAKAQARLAKTRARFAEGMSDAKEVKRDLEWTQKRVSTLKTKASRKHPTEHKKARERYPSPEY